MSFKAVITEEKTIMIGTPVEKLTGLMCYIDALIEIGISDQIIKEVVGEKLKDKKRIDTIVDNGEIKVQKIDLNDMTKEEAKEFLEKELLNKMFD